MEYVVVLDADGVVVEGEYFSKELEREYGIPEEEVLPFFNEPFQDCLVGEADLKKVVVPYLQRWGWDGTVDEFLHAWFRFEDNVRADVIDTVTSMEARAYVATNQEQYRTEYMREEMSFDTIFDDVLASAQLGATKPDQEFYKQVYDAILEDTSVQREHVLFWDDENQNVEGARTFGFTSYLYENSETFTRILRDYGRV